MKRAFTYRFHPMPQKAAELTRTFGCVRLVGAQPATATATATVSRDAAHRLARAISDAAGRDMRGMMEYKAAWYGRELVVIDRWYPSSKLCSACEHRADTMPLNIRHRTCTACGVGHDRDVNAALNILAAGPAER